MDEGESEVITMWDKYVDEYFFAQREAAFDQATELSEAEDDWYDDDCALYDE